MTGQYYCLVCRKYRPADIEGTQFSLCHKHGGNMIIKWLQDCYMEQDKNGYYFERWQDKKRETSQETYESEKQAMEAYDNGEVIWL